MNIRKWQKMYNYSKRIATTNPKRISHNTIGN